MSIVEIHYLTPRPSDQQFFTGSAVLDGWRWVVGRVSARFECDEDDIDCLEADDGGDDFVTVNGKPVARIVHRLGYTLTADRLFAEAAE